MDRLSTTAIGMLFGVLLGCASVDEEKVDHTVRGRNVGKARIVNMTWSYGSLGDRTLRFVGRGADSVTMPMTIPEVLVVGWTTERDGERHSAVVPIRSVVSPLQLSGRIVSIEVDDIDLGVYLVERIQLDERRVLTFPPRTY